MRLDFLEAKGEEEKSTLVIPCSISSGDLFTRLGKALSSQMRAGVFLLHGWCCVAWLDGLGWIILAFLRSPPLLSTISMCFIYCLLASFKVKEMD